MTPDNPAVTLLDTPSPSPAPAIAANQSVLVLAVYFGGTDRRDGWTAEAQGRQLGPFGVVDSILDKLGEFPEEDRS